MSTSRRTISPNARRYLQEIRQFTTLTLEQERDLAEALLKREPGAFETLVLSNLPFVVRIAADYHNLGVPFEDLLNEGNLGLIEAAQRFDTRKGTRFLTYAVWWIRKAMLKAAATHTTLVRSSYYQSRRSRRVRGAEEALTRELGRPPERSEVGARLGESDARLEQVLRRRVREISLDARVGKEGTTSISEFLVDATRESAEETLIHGENAHLLRRALQVLTPQEQRIVSARFGLVDGKPRSLREVGRALNLSGERVRQIEREALGRIRRFFARHASSRAACPAGQRGGGQARRRALRHHPNP
jgi:RNA polymerase primary sigma factor